MKINVEYFRYVLDFPTIERLNELNIFVTNAIVFDVQVSGILSIYTKCVSTRHVTQKRACACAFAPEVSS